MAAAIFLLLRGQEVFGAAHGPLGVIGDNKDQMPLNDDTYLSDNAPLHS